MDSNHNTAHSAAELAVISHYDQCVKESISVTSGILIRSNGSPLQLSGFRSPSGKAWRMYDEYPCSNMARIRSLVSRASHCRWYFRCRFTRSSGSVCRFSVYVRAVHCAQEQVSAVRHFVRLLLSQSFVFPALCIRFWFVLLSL